MSTGYFRRPGELCLHPPRFTFEVRMQFHKSKSGGFLGGCLDMAYLRVVASFCVTLGLALFLFLSLDLASRPCGRGRQNVLNNFRESLYLSSIQSGSIPTASEESYSSDSRCAASPSVCYSEWEKPSVVDERGWEMFWDENTPEVPRTFTPVGVSAFLFIQFGAYRGSPNNFSIVGLSPKALHIYGYPDFECYWIPKEVGETVTGNATHFLPEIKLARQYTATVIHCQFDEDVGSDGMGGILQIVANMGPQDMTGLQSAQFVSLTEKPGEYDGSVFEEPKKYDYMYCSGPLYGQISPQRVREWIAYHARLFGPRSHFILYDSGGLHEDVRKILAPWVKLGRVSIMNYRQNERYDSYLFSQAVLVNDCLLQAKRLAQWAFFFDIDEYLYVPPHLSLDLVMKDFADTKGRRAQQVTFDQRPMNLNHCVQRPENDSDERFQSLWGLEKLVFQRTQITERGGWKDHKYAVQTRYILAAGIHDYEFALVPDNMDQKQTITYVGCEGCEEDTLLYHHFHNTINIREELCKEFVDPLVKETKFNNVTHIYDNSLASLADAVRQFELETVGAQPFII